MLSSLKVDRQTKYTVSSMAGIWTWRKLQVEDYFCLPLKPGKKCLNFSTRGQNRNFFEMKTCFLVFTLMLEEWSPSISKPCQRHWLPLFFSQTKVAKQLHSISQHQKMFCSDTPQKLTYLWLKYELAAWSNCSMEKLQALASSCAV